MNYRHAFHAGNFADVFKHVFLTRILAYLMRKETPLRFIDTHAGIGWYDLTGDEARRTGEWRDGVAQLAEAGRTPETEALLQPYLDCIGRGFANGSASRYPGSPAIAAAMLRSSDRMIFCELHKADFRTLARGFARDRRVKTIEIDGYTALKAYVPPVERRGLVLIDPPFEERNEFTRIAEALAQAWRKWPTGMYGVWYPVKAKADCDGFFKVLGESGISNILRLELAVARAAAEGPLAANGLAIVNPPYVLEAEARAILPYLCETLGRDADAYWRIDRVAWTDE